MWKHVWNCHISGMRELLNAQNWRKHLQQHQYINIFGKDSDTLKRPFGNIWNVQENFSSPGFCQSAIWSRNVATCRISLSASWGFCIYIWECMPNSPACWMEMPGENWVPYVSVSRYLYIYIYNFQYHCGSIMSARFLRVVLSGSAFWIICQE